jgi:microcompartment protein CcmL/EutN
MNDSLAILEIKSIAKGFVVLDSLTKQAEVNVHIATFVSSGKFIIIFTGNIAEVEESFNNGLKQSKSQLIDSLFLPQAHFSLILAIFGKFKHGNKEAIAIIETINVSTCIKAADKALKMTSVAIISMKLANKIHGKGVFLLNGKLSEIEEAVNSIQCYIDSKKLIAVEIITKFNLNIEGFFYF